MTTNEKIVNLLRRSNLFAHEIKDALNISYGELWKSLEQLKTEGKVSQYFRETPLSATICFCLSENRKVPLSIRWGRGIKPWTPAAKPRLRPWL
jgi:hypothetical protein